MTLSENDLAYVAGFFDGEGSITIHVNGRPSPRGKVPNHTLQVSIGNTDPRVLLWLRQEFGGSITYRDTKRPNERICAMWVVRCALAKNFLQAIQPFVRMKGEQVAVAVAYQRTKRRRGPSPVSSNTIEWRELQRQTIRDLNARAHIQ